MSPSEFSEAAQKTELELYLDELRMNRTVNIDVLTFQKLNECRHPILASMACDILVVVVSTVASETSFNVGGRVLDYYRSSLRPDTVEELVCCRDQLYGDRGIVNNFFNFHTLSIMKFELI